MESNKNLLFTYSHNRDNPDIFSCHDCRLLKLFPTKDINGKDSLPELLCTSNKKCDGFKYHQKMM